MRETSPSGVSNSTTSLLSNGCVTKNTGFQSNSNSLDNIWNSGPSISLPKNTHLNLISDQQSHLQRTNSNASVLSSLCGDLSPSDSHFFEVLYVGKVRISQRKVPDSLIDDALHKFAQHEMEKTKTNQMRRHSLLSSTGTSVYSTESNESITDEQPKPAIKTHTEKKKVSFLRQLSTSSDKNVHKTFSSLDKIEDEEEIVPNHDDQEDVDDEFDAFTKERADHKISSDTQESKVETVEESLENIKECFKQIGNNQLFIDESTFDKDDNENSKSVSPEKVDKNQNNLEKVTEHVPTTIDENKINFGEIKRKPIEENTTTGFEDLAKTTLPENKKFLRDRAASIGTLNLKTPLTQIIEQNRTMLFQVGRSELRLISPDRKQILLHRAFKDVASCVVGRSQREHFGFVCRDSVGESYACYVFKCESDEVAYEIVTAIRQAFIAHAEMIKKTREKSPNLTCEHCPLLWYQRLTHDLQGLTDKKAHAFILRRIEQLSDDEQDQIINKYQMGTNKMYEVNEHIAFLMRLLKAHCESKQLRHVHDTAENRSEFLNQYLGSSTIFMKAKRSLSTGFDNLLKRRSSKDDNLGLPSFKKDSFISSPVDTPSPEPGYLSPEPARCKSLSPINQNYTDVPPSPTSVSAENVAPEETHETDEEDKPDLPASNSPMMDIFSKVSDSRSPTAASGAGTEQESTWRQAIYQTVLQPDSEVSGDLLSSNIMNYQEVSKPGKKTKADLRDLWKMAINQTILLVRMERENARLKEKEESSAVRRIKLEYTELGACETGTTLMWDSLLASRNSSPQVSKVDHHMLTQAVIQGVPRGCRGAVWYFLAEQASLRIAPPDPRTAPLYNTPYRNLLAGLTKHQHAILIDLGRTFPQHSYFASALGPGQLSLYNILKAYSLLDPDVGYCQGLSFVAGVLLLHMEEAEAFVLLRHLMFRRGLRKQYLPDMSALQVQLYQLSRLLRDHEPELHSKLESLEISPALYAAPWMLTLFTSQFPLGFVVRVFDLIFLESMDIIFSFSLALLSAHKDGLMLCESCEEAAEYLKHKLPDIDNHIYDKVIKKVYTLDISRQLSEYAVEYAVLREEMPRISILEETNRKLTIDNNRMSLELDSAMDAITNYQRTQAKLEAQSKMMDQQLALLSRYITATNRQDMTLDVKKIVQNYSKKRSKILPNFMSRDDEEEDAKKSLKVGMSSPNLFSRITPEDVMNAVNKEKTSPEKDRRHFMMKKSQSVHSGLIAKKHYPLKVLEEANENEKNRRTESFRTNNIIMESLKELGKKNIGHFAATHEQIRQERIFEQQLKHDFDENLKKLDEKLNQDTFEDDLDLFQSKKSVSLNIENRKSEQRISKERSEEGKDDVSIISHPLSDCDIDIKFDGQSTKLKQIRPLGRNH